MDMAFLIIKLEISTLTYVLLKKKSEIFYFIIIAKIDDYGLWAKVPKAMLTVSKYSI